MKKFLPLYSVCLAITLSSCGQSTSKMDFEKYDPVSNLVVPEHPLTKSKFPFIDVHNHQWNMGSQDLADLVKDMDKLNLQVMVNLSGGNGSGLQKMTENIKSSYPKRFIVFANINFSGIGETGWTEKAVKQLEEDVQHGANGLKIFKDLGLFSKRQYRQKGYRG